MFVQLFRSYFSEEIFSWSLSEWLSAQVGVFPKAKLVSIREKSKHTGEEKMESKEIQTTKKKSNIHRRCI
jgi:hypothetical protein